ncbi:unnamed protein product [Didymodactylos carnosus]|uniref:Uncharacterized protein n=1 Tax=Didymodactylos carnosus TaxID=1234261 RepID=A0A815EYR5_9BILA|nr:unnamed protein product [Didymodactylos carnosus]CAF1420140.1 unnamed protein product [Didymodactylos carnosus]CAF4167033.1 unnamed protein product [Didymodactylos carnosus]CAF4221036.1 unnamed protein product [Didymodactylos carnosus]
MEAHGVEDQIVTDFYIAIQKLVTCMVKKNEYSIGIDYLLKGLSLIDEYLRNNNNDDNQHQYQQEKYDLCYAVRYYYTVLNDEHTSIIYYLKAIEIDMNYPIQVEQSLTTVNM